MKIPSDEWILTWDLVKIPAGSFLMGSNESGDEQPIHQVTIGYEFYMGSTVVTQGQWVRMMGTRPWRGGSYVKEGDDYPAVYVSWDDAREFIEKLNHQAGGGFQLPSEAEWEYACRAGSNTRYFYGDNESQLEDYAWYHKNAWDIGEQYAHQVRRKQPNAWGLYDMLGNVCEWCADWYGSDYYASSPSTDPQGPSSGTYRVLRGGSWDEGGSGCRSACRSLNPSVGRDFCCSFRLVWAART